MELDSYEINKETCAILNLSEEVSKVIENTQEYILPKNTFEIMEDSCNYYGSTYDGRIKGTKMLLGSNYKLPIIIEEQNFLIFFPTTGVSNEKCSWISLNNIQNYVSYNGCTKVIFTSGKQIILKIPFNSFETQLFRATRLQVLLKKRTGV